jgi:hypothetical protein
LSPTLSRTRLKAIASQLSPGDDEPTEERTLWRCILRVDLNRDEFLFRSTDDFEQATIEALQLVDRSQSCRMTKARVVAIERVARLWN